ncbi:hypothetical protein L484_010490 [Morus notabilis]|uniref:Uncharacterized protein n=1 Tax=Morus notabilis TaxID=981085 RepID=W9QPJ5_9ROSA|nr:hypothetical protein L484_010490 [Morus notabilis]
MTTLQRSSVSFRRQGSSGRTWNDRLQFQALESKTSHSTFLRNKREEEPLTNLQRNQERNFNESKMVSSRSISSSSHSNDDQKVQRCFLSLLFRRCMGSPTA